MSGEWDWVEGAKATAEGAREGYEKTGSVYGAVGGGFLGFIGYASDNPGVGKLWTSAGPEQRTALDQSAALGVLRAEWGTVGGMGWTHPEGDGRKFNGQDVAFRLRYMAGGLWTDNPHRNDNEALAAGVSPLRPEGFGYQQRDPAGSYVLNGRTFTGFDNPEMAYIAIECEGAWGERPVLSFRTYPKATAQRELFAMGCVGQLPADTVYVEAAVFWGQQGSPMGGFSPERTILQGVGFLRASWPVVVIWRTQKRGAREADRVQWTYGVQMVPPGNAPSYAPYDQVATGEARRGLGAAGWLGVAGLAAPIVAALVKR